MLDIVIASPREASSQYRDFVTANVCGNGRAPWTKGLAPENFGPVDLYAGKTARLFVNGWNFAHVYADQLTAASGLTDEYADWAERGWASSMPQYHPKGVDTEPLYVLWDGELLQPTLAWFKIYFPMYRDLVKATDSFERLRALSQSQRIVLVDDLLGTSAGKQYLSHAIVIKAMLEHGVDVTAAEIAGHLAEQIELEVQTQ
jgi:hypothetical protein